MPLTILSVAYPFAPVGPDAVGGAEQVLSTLDFRLTQAGHRSIVLASENSVVAGTHWPVPLEKGTIGDLAKQRAWARHRHAIEDIRRRYAVDLTHLHGIDFDIYCPGEGPTLVTLHLPLDWYRRGALQTRRRDLWMHCVSSAQDRGASPSGLRLLPPVHNGVDLDALAGRHAKRDLVLFLGRICPEKGIHLAIDAAQMAGLPLIIAGQVFPYEAHQRYFEENVAPRLGRGCRFVGALDRRRKRRFLSAARCLLLPSQVAETSSLVAMEALACGTPVIAFRCGALPEIISNGRTGFLVDNIKEMAEAIRAARELDGDLCRSEARRRFSLEAMLAAYLDLYHGLAARSFAAG